MRLLPISTTVLLFTSAVLSAGCAPEVDEGGDPATNAAERAIGEDACTAGVVGDGTTCRDLGALKMAAYDTCVMAGQALMDLQFSDAGCNGAATQAAYSCCAPLPPPEYDPGTCEDGVLGDGTTCQDLGTLKVAAYELCADAGGFLMDLQYAQDGCDGQAGTGSYTCCGLPDPAP